MHKKNKLAGKRVEADPQKAMRLYYGLTCLIRIEVSNSIDSFPCWLARTAEHKQTINFQFKISANFHF